LVQLNVKFALLENIQIIPTQEHVQHAPLERILVLEQVRVQHALLERLIQTPGVLHKLHV
jgi:hypothetical protein